MLKSQTIANYLLEDGAIIQTPGSVSIPGTSTLRNDYGEKIFPHGFVSDTTLLTPKEIQDVIVFMSETGNPRLISNYIKQTEDNLATVEKLGQKNRVQDLKIRLGITYAALALCDRLGKYTHHE